MSVAVVRERFVNLLMAVAAAESKLDVTKQVLSEKEDFSPQIAFHFIAPMTPFITVQDIKSFLLENDKVVSDYD
jgi:hypothetical protein